MGGGKKKYQKREKYVSKEKKLGKYEENIEPKEEEDVKALLELWQKNKE